MIHTTLACPIGDSTGLEPATSGSSEIVTGGLIEVVVGGRQAVGTVQHIPPARVQLIRRYGLYSSRIKGHWTRMPYVLQRAPSGWTSQNDQNAATASNRAGSPEVPATETDAPDARERRHAWARLLARVYEVDPLVCPRCGARLEDCRRQSRDPQ